MRIMHVDTGTEWRGGQQQVLWLLEGCRDRGFEQRLLTPAGSPLAQRARQAGIAVNEIARRTLALENLRTVRRLAAEHDLAHAHDAHGHSLLCAVNPFRAARGPALIVSRRVGFPIGTVGRSKYRIPDLFIAVSEFVRWQLVGAGVPEEKIQVVMDGVDAPRELPNKAFREESRRCLGVGEGEFVLGTLSSFAPEKLLAEELKPLEQLPAQTRFWLGVPNWEPERGSAANELRNVARRMGLEERFQIVPVGEDPAAFLSSLDLFLYLSRMEGLGSAILLAMAYELPVIASDVGGIPEIVRHGQTGMLVRDDVLQELPSAVQVLMASPATRRRMGVAGREFVMANSTNDRMVAQTVRLYQELLQGSRPARP